MDAEGNQYKQSGFSQIKTLHEAFLFNNTLILRRNVPADPPCSNKLSIWRQLLLASSHTKKRQSHHPVELSSTFSSFSFTKKVCQSQPPTDFLFAPEIIFGVFFKTGSSFCRIKKKARKFLANQRAFFWSEQRDLNPRPPRPERGALPTALCPENTAAYSAAVTGWG